MWLTTLNNKPPLKLTIITVSRKLVFYAGNCQSYLLIIVHGQISGNVCGHLGGRIILLCQHISVCYVCLSDESRLLHDISLYIHNDTVWPKIFEDENFQGF